MLPKAITDNISSMDAWMYACMRGCMCLCICSRMCYSTCGYRYVCMQAYSFSCHCMSGLVCIYTDYVSMSVCTHVRMYVCTYVRMYVCRYVGKRYARMDGWMDGWTGISYPTLPYPTLPYPTLPYPTLPYPTYLPS